MPQLITQQSIPVELIQAKAYEIWATRERKGENGSSEDDWSNAIEFLNKQWWFVSSWKINRQYQELKVFATTSIKNAISFKTLSQAVNASVLIGAITFIAGEQQRRDLQVYQAWQVITAAHGQPGSGGRVQALEFLSSEPRKIPWFWLRWQRESLSGLEVPTAYLVPSRKDIEDFEKKGGIQLLEADLNNANLQGADLEYANLQRALLIETNLKEAILFKANLKGAILFKANLQKALLFKSNLQEANLSQANLQEAKLIAANLQRADLSQANLQEANLSQAKLQEAKYTDKSTSAKTCESYSKDYPCPTIFPLNFDPEAAGMTLLK
ncbi:pentapeptide repeat-containing protein [Nostoc sp.]|uniref:pentapeptide repeat-containing protein n=1 Tax=Nostoc sp. TaxID=1180 RepID=UPI002FF75C6E